MKRISFSHFNKKLILFFGIGILWIGSALIGGYYLFKYKESIAVTPKQVTSENDEVKQILAEVNAIIEVPQNEDPTIASVTDAEKLHSQPFFAKAVNGDKVIIWNEAKKAILYRPSEKKIIEISMITLGDDRDGLIKEQPFTVMLLNGTITAGLTKKVEQKLLKIYPDAVIVDRDNAKVDTYETTIIVDMKGDRKTEAEDIAKNLGIELSTLPAGEATTGATYNFLIIAGKDWK